jgi:two-component system cell cycle sensor histidine kinase PleC
MTIPQDVAADPWQIVADLQQRIAASHAEREVLELALRESEERYALAMRAINEGFYEWDVVTSEMRYSPRVCELVGLAPEELRTMADWTDRIHPTDMPEFRKAILAHFKGETEWLEGEYRYRHADGRHHRAKSGRGGAAREPGAADRDCRGLAGHQFLTRRPHASVRRDA